MDLYEAFALVPGAIVAAVGGGGKTSLVHALAAAAAGRGLSAVVTTTTKFTRPPGMPMPPVIETSDLDAARDIGDRLHPRLTLVACTGIGPRARLLGFEPGTIAAIAAVSPGLIAVEADGSAQRPFKAPGEHEPAIPAAATDVIVCVGLEVLGHELGARWVHRPELVATLAEASQGDPVTADMIVRVLLHDRGGRRALPPGARIHALLNNPPTGEHEILGMHIAERLVYGGFWRSVVATAHRPHGDVRAVVK